MKCDHAVQLCTCCICGCTVHTPVGWLEVFLQATETCPNSEKKNTSRQGMKNAENSNFSSSIGFGPTLTTKLFAGWLTIMTKLSAGFLATLCRTSIPSRLRVNRVVIFFNSFELLFFSLSYLLTAKNGSVFFLGPGQVLVMQSFGFSFRLSKVGSLIE